MGPWEAWIMTMLVDPSDSTPYLKAELGIEADLVYRFVPPHSDVMLCADARSAGERP
jgi:hypothetical protein